MATRNHSLDWAKDYPLLEGWLQLTSRESYRRHSEHQLCGHRQIY